MRNVEVVHSTKLYYYMQTKPHPTNRQTNRVTPIYNLKKSIAEVQYMTIVDKVFIPWSTFLRAWRSFSAVWLCASSSKLPQWASAPPCTAVLGPASSASTTGDDRHVVEWWDTAANHTTTRIQINVAILSNTGHGEGNNVANGSKSSSFDRFGWFELHHNVAEPLTYV